MGLGQSGLGRVAGCDLTQEMLKATGDLEGRLQMAPIELPFESETFDLVTAVCVYHHVGLSDRDALTWDAFRVLRPGGVLCVIEHNPINPVTRRIVQRTPVDANANLLPHSEARRLVGSAGFSCLDTRFFLYLPEIAFRRMCWLEAFLKHVPLGGQYALFAGKNWMRRREWMPARRRNRRLAHQLSPSRG